jgi:Gpi18-like mannosyltransferase
MDINSGQIFDMTLGMTVAVIVVPILLLALAFRFKDHFKSPSIFLMVLLAYGIVSRLVVAPFTGHPYDMGVWTQAVRLFYESGVMDIRTFPLPLNYYLLLLAYSPYALLRTIGFQDAGFLAHNFKMLEAVFIKAPFILSDLLSFYFLFKILNRIGNGKLNSSGRFLYAFVYFLSPLAIVLSSVWGMYDGIAVALFLAGTYYTLFEGKPFRGAVFYALSGLTKAFGFLGLIPIAFTLLREKKYFQLLAMFGMVSVIVILLYLPLLAVTGLQAVPELFMQFIRGRVGLGSISSYVASTSYMSYLSLLGFDVTSPYLTYLLIVLVLFISVCFGLKARGSNNETYIRLTLGYFAVVFFVFYLTFFRVYEQYYLWVIPVLIIYSYLKKESGPAFVALGISVVVLPILILSVFLTGTEYYWIPFNLPADTAIVAVLPSTIVALGLIGITCSKGPLAILKTWKGMLFSASLALWFSFGFAYYAYYGVPPLGVFWYFVSFMIILAAVVFLFKRFRSIVAVKELSGS